MQVEDAPAGRGVRYLTDTGRALSLDVLYLCKNCDMPADAEGRRRARLKGPFDVEEEVDYVFCPACLEHVPEVEAKLFGYRCAKCFLCPVCFSQLQTTSITAGGGGSAKDTDLFVFSCGLCKWESSSIGVTAREAAELVLSRLKAERNDPLDNLVARMAVDMAALDSASSTLKTHRPRTPGAPTDSTAAQGKSNLSRAPRPPSRDTAYPLTRNGMAHVRSFCV